MVLYVVRMGSCKAQGKRKNARRRGGEEGWGVGGENAKMASPPPLYDHCPRALHQNASGDTAKQAGPNKASIGGVWRVHGSHAMSENGL